MLTDIRFLPVGAVARLNMWDIFAQAIKCHEQPRLPVAVPTFASCGTGGTSQTNQDTMPYATHTPCELEPRTTTAALCELYIDADAHSRSVFRRVVGKLAGFFLPARSKPTHLQSHPGKASAQKPGSRRAGQDVICCLCMHVQHAGIHPSIHCRNQCLPADSPARCRCKPQVKGPLWRRRHRSRRLPPLADHKMAAAAVGDWSPLRKAFTHKHLKGFCGVNVTHTHRAHPLDITSDPPGTYPVALRPCMSDISTNEQVSE